MSALVVTVPLSPPRELFPNTRSKPDPRNPGKYKAVGWREKAGVIASTRLLAYHTAREALLFFDGPSKQAVRYSAVISWEKGRRTLDDDSAIASLKAYRDGIADALGINDRHMRFVEIGQERVSDGEQGFVTFTITDTDEGSTTE